MILFEETVFQNHYAEARKLVGLPLARRIQNELRQRVKGLPTPPGLAIIHISPDSAADTYVRLKRRFGEAIGVSVKVLQPRVEELPATIERLNAQPDTNGIIIQLPLPEGAITTELLAAITPTKDIDGLGPTSPFVTAGPRGIMELLETYAVKLDGLQVALLGTGRLMGGPLLPLLLAAGAKVEAFDLEHPFQLAALHRAKLVIGATGQRHLITVDMIGPGTTVIDATGVDTDPALQQRDDIRITPTTGGVGPMTVAALFENLVVAAESAVQNHND